MTQQYLPDVDICETEEALWLWADMPGVTEDSVHVHLEEGRLSIGGRVSLADYENLAPVYREYNVGHFVREFRISEEVDADRIQARMANGVLEIEMPKAERKQSRRIPVTAG
jgi:HSP20 family protein